MHNDIPADFRRLETLRRRLRTLEDRYAAISDRNNAEARQIAEALACARASLDLAYGNLPTALGAAEGERAH